jgi:hypothetical protein
MAEQIGELVPTQIASLSEVADIQEAFRLYHYGAATGTGIGQYDPTNTNAANLIQPSIAYSLNFLNDKVTFLETNLGVQATQWTGKGALVTATSASTLSTLSAPATNNFVLISDSTTTTGLRWAAPEVTLSNTVELLNKTINLTGNTFTGTLAQFNTALSDADFSTIEGSETLTNKTLSSPVISTPSITTPTITDSTVNLQAGVPDTSISVVSNRISTWVIDGAHNPTLNLVRGRTYTFTINAFGRPFWIQTTAAPYNAANVVTEGITGNGTSVGTLTYTVPETGVTTLYYVDQNFPAMTGIINIVDAPSFTTTVKTAEATAAREIVFPNAGGTVITTGNLNDIVSLGQISSIYSVGPVIGHPNVFSVATTMPILLAASDGTVVVTTASEAVTVQIPGDNLDDDRENHPIGSQITVIQQGTGQVTFLGAGGASVNGTPGLKLRARYSSATCLKIGTNSWIVSGDLVA